MFKKIIAVTMSIVVVLAFAACGSQPNSTGDGKIKVSVSFNALREFVTAVGGDKVAVSVIVPDGVEPHDFEPKAQDLAALGEADIFVINGLGMEVWAEDAIKAAGSTDLIIVDASTGAETLASDPHIWLSLKCAETEAKNIRDALVKADSVNKDYYESNYDTFVSQLEQLYNNYNGKFTAVHNKSFVTGHAAFAYLCRDFSLTQESVEDVFAEGEPSAQQLSSLIEYCKANHVTTVFSEAFENPEVADTLARETGAQVKPIYTIESVENGTSYLERMEENLRVIYESLN